MATGIEGFWVGSSDSDRLVDMVRPDQQTFTRATGTVGPTPWGTGSILYRGSCDDSSAIRAAIVASNAFTFAAVLRRNSTGNGMVSLGSNGDSTGWYSWSAVGAVGMKVYTASGNNELNSTIDLTVDEWNVWVATWDGAFIKHYINGSAAGSLARAGVWTSHSHELEISSLNGAATTTVDYACWGIWSRALVESEAMAWSADPFGVVRRPSHVSRFAALDFGGGGFQAAWATRANQIRMGAVA